MNKSESIAALAAALSKAQAAITGAVKDKTNPHFRTKYADLGAVVDAIQEPTTKNGLSFVQVIHDDAPNAAKVETIILHSSGEWLSCGVVSVPVSKGDAQGYGSALTYARRYSLSAAFGVAPEDDDGNAASKAQPRAVNAPKPVPAPKNVDTETGEFSRVNVEDWFLEMEGAASRDDLRTVMQTGMASAKEAGDSEAFKRIKAKGAEIAADKFKEEKAA